MVTPFGGSSGTDVPIDTIFFVVKVFLFVIMRSNGNDWNGVNCENSGSFVKVEK